MAMKSLTTALQEYDEKYYSHRLPASDIQSFGTILKKYIADIDAAYDEGESEEHTKKIINSFLEQAFYHGPDFQINTLSRIDSAIKYRNRLLALIETKRVNSKSEMVSADNINKKALWELILYYLNETRDTSGKRVKRKVDAEIRRLIITDGLKWVSIDAPDFENLCDGFIERHYYKYKNNQLTYKNDNAKFYEDISEYLSQHDVTKTLPFVFFDLSELRDSRKSWGIYL